jgi:hypothetical protein
LNEVVTIISRNEDTVSSANITTSENLITVLGKSLEYMLKSRNINKNIKSDFPLKVVQNHETDKHV